MSDFQHLEFNQCIGSIFDPGHACTAWYTSQGVHHMVHCMFNAGHWITLGVDVWSIGHFVKVVLGHYYFLDL